MDSRDQVLRGKTLRLVKVLWQHQEVEEATWECEDTIRTNYPLIFEDEGMFFSHLILKRRLHMHVLIYACVCEFRGRNSVKGGRM